MIQGNKRLTHADVIAATNNGKDVFIKYLGKIHRSAIKRPWGKDEHPSFGVFQSSSGEWMWKDQAREEVGGAIQLVQRMFNLTYAEAIRKVMFDFGLGDEAVKASRAFEENSPIAQELQKDYAHITCKVMKFKERHHQFWNAVGVSEEWCKKFDCYAVKELAINHKKMLIGEHERVFVYHAKDIDKVKVYFPDRESGGRFRNNVPFKYLWCHNNLKNCDKLVVHKSMKDLITFAQIHPHNIATQNESAKLFDEGLVNTINGISSNVTLFYGSDKDGMTKAKEVIKLTGWKMLNTPTSMLPDVNDAYSYVKQYGLEKLEELCKIKNVL